MARSGYIATLFGSIFDQRRDFAGWRADTPIVDQCRVLMSARGEALNVRLARSILASYRDLESEGRLEFFDYLADELDIVGDVVAEHAAAYGSDPSVGNLKTLLEAAEPARQTLFRKLNEAEGATEQLVALRENLLDAIRDNPDLGKIDLDLVHLFTSWFNRGFLVLQRIDWSTPARVLEKIIAYEAVHEIGDWDDLRRRTEPPDRRCYAYVHPQMPEEPLIFVEVALTKGVPESIQDVLSDNREVIPAEAADTAVFYSISNCQRGLQGISFGESLIKHVVADLSLALPHLKTFVTLSPIPGLRKWIVSSDQVPAGLVEQLISAAAASDSNRIDAVSEDLRALAAVYLSAEKRSDGLPSNSVARFHLSNGAEIHNVLAGADLSASGLSGAFGAMVNYRYKRRDLERNSESFASSGTVRLSRKVQAFARTGQALLRRDKAAPE